MTKYNAKLVGHPLSCARLFNPVQLLAYFTYFLVDR